MKKRKRRSSFFDEFEFWITLGVSVAQEKIVVLGFARSKWEAQAAGLERNVGPEKCEHWEVFRFGDDLGQKIRDWFVTCGMSRQDADDSARELAKSIKGNCLESQVGSRSFCDTLTRAALDCPPTTVSSPTHSERQGGRSLQR